MSVFASIAARFAVVVLLVFSNAFFVRARGIDATADARVRVTFPFDSADLRSDYMSNASAISSINEILNFSEGSVDVEIVSYSSPEGPESYNLYLSKLRAASVKNYILSAVPGANPSIRIASFAEAWAQLRAFIVADNSLTEESRLEFLLIIDSDNTLDEKEELIKANPLYKALYRRYFRSLRYADISLRIKNLPAAVAQPVGTTVSQIDTTIAQIDTITVAADTSAVVIDTLQRLSRLDNISTKAVLLGECAPVIITRTREPEREPVCEPTPEDAPVQYDTVSVPFLAITNNFLAEAATVLTGFHTVPVQAGIEVPIGDQWSVYADYLGTAPWKAWNNNADCAQLLHWTLGTRWYPGSRFSTPFNPGGTERVLDGWYASFALGGGYYDFERNGKGYQGEEVLASLGLGYSMVFDKHWSLNFGVGFGPMLTQWRYYVEKPSNQHLVYQWSGKSQYFGVTDAKVTLTYLFYVNKKQKKN